MSPQIAELKPATLNKYSELVGGRKVRDFEYYHLRGYGTSGHTTLEYFRTDGQQQDISGSVTTATHISNMVTSGKFDEPFITTAIGVCFIPLATADNDKIADTLAVLNSGQLIFELNNIPIFWRTPIIRCGTVINYNGFATTYGSSVTYGGLWSQIKPHSLDPFWFAEEGITFKVDIKWSTAVSISTASLLGVYLIGGKYFKS